MNNNFIPNLDPEIETYFQKIGTLEAILVMLKASDNELNPKQKAMRIIKTISPLLKKEKNISSTFDNLVEASYEFYNSSAENIKEFNEKVSQASFILNEEIKEIKKSFLNYISFCIII